MALLQANGVIRLSSDIELRYTPSGTAIASFSVVSSNKHKTQQGEDREDTCFIQATVFGTRAEILNQYVKKGSKLFIRGELKLDTWTDQQGQKKSKHSIHIKEFEFLDCKESQSAQQGNGTNQSSSYAQENDITPMPEIDIGDDTLPF